MNDWARENRKLIAVFAAGVLLGAISVRQGYEGFRFAGSEYVLIKKASIPKSLSLSPCSGTAASIRTLDGDALANLAAWYACSQDRYLVVAHKKMKMSACAGVKVLAYKVSSNKNFEWTTWAQT